MKDCFECHITMRGKPDDIRPKVEKEQWSFSCIDGDPLLGAGVKCYATNHFPKEMSVDAVIKELKNTVKSLQNEGVIVIRMKIELIIYDKTY